MRHKRIVANGIDFAYLEEGEGPLALLLHGFPEAPSMYRHLTPVLAEAGYRAVAPALRGFAPTQIPPDGSMRITDLIADANCLHEELGGDTNAVIVGHDWGGFATWGSDGTLLEGVGHFPFLEKPDEVNQRILRFLAA
ncbi:alpha/beta fold hydrolase [Nonomuraea sp. B12E4]|uniref:alpha/beta fold hydrolase n=1 Tax=Nonomuraea sp. B12E4 TaxID=3153564 RepID=UPI00325D32FA